MKLIAKLNWALGQNLALLLALMSFSIVFLVSARADPLETESEALKTLWSIEATFIQPESAAFDPITQSVFVSNVNGYAKDGNGFVSRVSADGNDIELKWLEGISSPTGLTVSGGSLFVVDYDELLEIDIASATIKNRYSTTDVKPALNDVAVGDQGNIFVSGSLSNSIYTIQDGVLKTWLRDDELLKSANGLYIDEGVLVFGGQKLLFFDLDSKQLLRAAPDKLADIDGIATDGCGGYIVSLIEDQRLWWLSSSGRAKPLSEDALDGIDLVNYAGDLFVPRVGGGLSRLTISARLCN